MALALSLSLTDRKTLPDLGSLTPAASCDLTKASAKVLPTPMTSSVDFISGPRMVSTPGNLTKGKTASLTEKYGGMTSCVIPCAGRLLPDMQRAAIFASCKQIGRAHV